MTTQIVSLELQRWIDEQTANGVAAEAVLEAMVTSGWRREVARGALHAALEAQQKAQRESSVAPARLPEPQVADGAHRVAAGDREVLIVSTLRAPRLSRFFPCEFFLLLLVGNLKINHNHYKIQFFMAFKIFPL